MGLQDLYQAQMDELTRGVPFVTSVGLRVMLLAPAADEWRRHGVREAKRVYPYRDVEWFDWPESVLDERDVFEFVTGVVDWDAAVAGIPCTREAREQAARQYPPFRHEVLLEIRRRRGDYAQAVVALGKGSAPSSPSSSSTPTAPPSAETSPAAAGPSGPSST